MSLRTIVLGTAERIRTFRRAADRAGVVIVDALVTDGRSPLDALVSTAHDAVCILDPAPSMLDTIEAQARAGKSVFAAGPPTDDLAAFDRLAAISDRSGSALVVGGSLREQPVGRVLREVVAQGRIGAPVYLRYVAETHRSASVTWSALDAADLATWLLGEPDSVYAVGLPANSAPLEQLSLTIRHRNGAVSLLSTSVAGAQRGEPSALLIGDRGSVEPTHGGGVVVRDTADGSTLTRLHDDPADLMATWLQSAARCATDPVARTAAIASGRQLTALFRSLQRSLVTGRPEAVPPSTVPSE